MSYHVGAAARVTNTFTNTAGTATDPTTVTFQYTTPAGVTTTLVYGTDVELVKSGVGVYYVDIPVTEGGTWRYRWDGDGAVDAATQGTFDAYPSEITALDDRLVAEVRRLVGAGTAEYTLNGKSYWTDSQLQTVLDRHGSYQHRIPVEWVDTYDGSGGITYKRGRVWHLGRVENPGTLTGALEDDQGTAVVGWTLDDHRWLVLATPVTTGEPDYYWSGTTYDVYRAAGDVLEQWAAMVKLEFQFAADNQQFHLHQKHAQLLAQAAHVRALADPVIG